MAGEIALERLQKAGEARVAAGGRTFANHFELAAYLLDRAASILKGPAPDSALGRVDLLYALLSRLGLANPDRLEPYIGALNADSERRPLAEQVVDQLLAEDKARYQLYEELKSARDRSPWKEQERQFPPGEPGGHRLVPKQVDRSRKYGQADSDEANRRGESHGLRSHEPNARTLGGI